MHTYNVYMCMLYVCVCPVRVLSYMYLSWLSGTIGGVGVRGDGVGVQGDGVTQTSPPSPAQLDPFYSQG